jgi:hypothetical protein
VMFNRKIVNHRAKWPRRSSPGRCATRSFAVSHETQRRSPQVSEMLWLPAGTVSVTTREVPSYAEIVVHCGPRRGKSRERSSPARRPQTEARGRGSGSKRACNRCGRTGYPRPRSFFTSRFACHRRRERSLPKLTGWVLTPLQLPAESRGACVTKTAW